jgi:hypothetical protein
MTVYDLAKCSLYILGLRPKNYDTQGGLPTPP